MLQLLASLFLVWFGFALRGWADRQREDRSLLSHVDAMGMEIRYCGQLAATYLNEGIKAPLYRLPSEAYRAAMPELRRAQLVMGGEAHTLQRFYLQVEQVNRGLITSTRFFAAPQPSKKGKE